LKEHQNIVDLVATMGFSLVMLIGEEFLKCESPDSFLVFANNSLLIKYLEESRPSGFYFLIKGSRGMKLESVIEKL